jgi:hypothetical protein
MLICGHGAPGRTSDQLRFLLTAGKIRDALELLNILSTCRFTALYRFDTTSLQNLVLIDREKVDSPLMDTIPVCDSYCAFVQASGTAFVVEDSLADARVTGHPKQPVVRSYIGFPLTDAQGVLFGTLCHFDFEVAAIPEYASTLTEQVAAFLEPNIAFDMLTASFDRSIHALDGMLELILAASTDRESAVDAFDAYAGPIRDDALGRLPVDRYGIVESKLAQLRTKVVSAF